MKRIFFLVILVASLLLCTAYAQEPITELFVDIRVGGSGAITLPDGTFVLAGNDGTLGKVRPAKAVSIDPFGRINWEMLDYSFKKSSNDYVSLTALSSGRLVAENFSPTRDNKTTLTEIRDGKNFPLLDLHGFLNVSVSGIDDDMICITVSEADPVKEERYSFYPRLTRYDSQGNVLWSKSYDKAFGGRIVAADEGFYLVGSLSVTPGKETTSHAYAAKMDAYGEIKWEQIFTGVWMGLSNGITTNDGSLVAVGSYQSSETSAQSFVVKFGRDGDLIWRKDFFDDNARCNSIIETEQGFLTVGVSYGADNNYILLTLLSREGKLLRQWRVGEDLERPSGATLHTTPYGIYLIASIPGTESNGSKHWALIRKIEISE